MRRSPDVSPRRLSDISPQLRQLKFLVVDEAIKEDLKWSRSVEDLTSGPVGLTSIEERILRITGYYGYQPWATSYKSKTPYVISLPPGGLPARDTAAREVQSEGPLHPPSCTRIGNFNKEAWRQFSCTEATGGLSVTFALLSASQIQHFYPPPPAPTRVHFQVTLRARLL